MLAWHRWDDWDIVTSALQKRFSEKDPNLQTQAHFSGDNVLVQIKQTLPPLVAESLVFCPSSSRMNVQQTLGVFPSHVILFK